MNPRVLKEEGFKHLDRVIDLCAQQGIYTILDLHAAAGGQNTDWHCDAGTHIANFWLHKDFQDRTIWLWKELAKHYANNKWIAGYNPLNEPTDPTHTAVIKFYDQVHDAIHSVDTEHIIFFDGNTFASDFSHFGDMYKKWQNTAYSIHGMLQVTVSMISFISWRRQTTADTASLLVQRTMSAPTNNDGE
jgi:aryl-phospho-beta-D-glucosidase BglC (GH1 family)